MYGRDTVPLAGQCVWGVWWTQGTSVRILDRLIASIGGNSVDYIFLPPPYLHLGDPLQGEIRLLYSTNPLNLRLTTCALTVICGSLLVPNTEVIWHPYWCPHSYLRLGGQALTVFCGLVSRQNNGS